MNQIKEIKNQSDFGGGFTRVRKPLITWSHGWCLNLREKILNIFMNGKGHCL